MDYKILFFLVLTLANVQLYAHESNHRKAASEMMQASGVPLMLERSFKAQLENQFKALPVLEKIRPQLTEFYSRAYSFKELENELALLYMKHYSLEEMKQITAFYRTPAGRKKALVDTRLSGELGELFLRHSEKKMPELQKLLQKHSRELRESGK